MKNVQSDRTFYGKNKPVSLFTWRLNPQTRKFSLVSEKIIGVTYGPIRHSGTRKHERIRNPDRLTCVYYAEFFKGRTVRVVQRTPTTKGQVDLLEIDGFVYARLELEDGQHCYQRARHIKARLYWTHCPGKSASLKGCFKPVTIH